MHDRLSESNVSKYSRHQQFLKDVKLELQLEFPEARFFDQDSGLFITQQGNYIRIGVDGMADIRGLFKSQYGPIHFEIEIKTNTATQNKAQKAWEKFIRGMNGIYIVVSNRKSILSQVDKLYRLKEFLNE